ncbi:MAG: carboxy terminal-processing peptidase [Verrucomicrobia bacterium]|nr:carboxy terminal-processing peptidase [Verrucomicrobiota bacterium]
MRVLSILLSTQVLVSVATASLSSLDTNAPVVKYTNVAALVPDPNDANIAKVIANLLEHNHYLRTNFNDEVSSKFFEKYLENVDNLRLYFLQSDIEEFEGYRYHLDELTKSGDTTPARVIFSRFRQRLDQQFDYVFRLLESEKFTFTGDDRYVVNRKDQPRPKDIQEARRLWRDRLRFEYLQEKLNKETHENIVRILQRRYNRILRLINDYDASDVLQIYLTSLARVYDPHSDYMGKAEFENFEIGMKLSLYGIGALLRSEDGICRIQSLTPEGPAERSGKLHPDDKIIAVAQSNQPPVEVVDMPLRKVVELIRGPKGTEAVLTIIPASASDPSVRQTVKLLRDEIRLEDQAAKAKVYEVPVGNGDCIRLGVVDLPSFYSGFEMDRSKGPNQQKSTTADVARLLNKLVAENVAGVILDLRRNGGGSLEEAINLTGLFIDSGPVVQVKDANGRETVDEDKNDPFPGEYYRGPLMVLTSRFSASASEILAGALQDYDRALIVGDSSTHGKGTVQSLIRLAPLFRASGVIPSQEPGALKVTIRKFYRASGASTQKKGVIPDIVLPSLYNDAKIGEAALENPMDWDEISSARFEKLNRISPHLAELKANSAKRVATDPDFAYLAEEIKRANAAREEKSVSMNEATRLKEKNEAEDRAKKRKKELAARPQPTGQVYEITLKNAHLPGLPPPVTPTKTASTSSIPSPPPPRGEPAGHSSPVPARPARRGFMTFAPRGEPAGHSSPVPAAVATNDLAQGTPAPAPAGAEDAAPEEDEEAAPKLDITLEEAKRILMDLVRLSHHGDILAAAVPKDKKAP